MNKRGISHIEVMLSFLIFAGFVIFALYIFNPFQQASRLVNSSLDYAIREIINNATTNIEIFSVYMDVSERGNVKKIKIAGVDSKKNAVVENRHGIIVPSRRDGVSDNTDFDSSFVHDGDPTKGFATFKFSYDFSAGTLTGGGGGQLDEDKYKIGSYNKMELLSEKKIKELNNSYYTDYSGLKRGFNLPERVDFSFMLQFDSNDFIEAQKKVPDGVELFSDIKRVEVLRTNGDIKFANLIVRVW